MKFAIWGCRHGHIEEFIGQMLLLGHEFLGICEPNGKISKYLSEKYGVPLFSSEEEMFAHHPQIVGSSAVNNEKVEIVLRCLEESVHVMVDKPIVTNQGDYARLKHQITKFPDVQIGMMLTERFNPGVITLKKLIEREELGELIGFTILKPHKLTASTRDSWHFSKEQNGGIIVDLMVHDFDLLRWLTGSEVAQTSGYVKIGDVPGYSNFLDDARVLVLMKNGITASLQTDWWMPDAYWTYGQGNIICTGKKGRCVVHTTGNRFLGKEESVCVLTTQDQKQTILNNEPSTVNLAEDFLNRIAGKPSIITMQDILMATQISLDSDQKVQRIIT